MINVLSYGMKCSIPLLFVLAIYTSILICFYMLFSFLYMLVAVLMLKTLIYSRADLCEEVGQP